MNIDRKNKYYIGFIHNLPNNFKLSKVWQQAATLELLPHLVFILSLAAFI